WGIAWFLASSSLLAERCRASVVLPPPGIQLTISNEGPAHDSFGNTTKGWSGYLFTLTADPGGRLVDVDLGSQTGSDSGIRGTLLQERILGESGLMTTPVGFGPTDTNGNLHGADSHLLASSTNVVIG